METLPGSRTLQKLHSTINEDTYKYWSYPMGVRDSVLFTLKITRSCFNYYDITNLKQMEVDQGMSCIHTAIGSRLDQIQNQDSREELESV